MVARHLVVVTLLAVTGGMQNVVDVEIYYGPYCANSARWLEVNMPELMGADLEGISLLIYPYVMENGEMPNPTRCDREGVPCHYLPAPLCALQDTLMPARPVDIRASVDFVICDLMHANRGAPAEMTHTKQDIEACATSNGIDVARLRQCMAHPRPNVAYLSQVKDVRSRLPNDDSIQLPYVFVDGQFMDVSVQPDLLEVLCSKYYPPPAACSIARRRARHEVGTQLPSPSSAPSSGSSAPSARLWIFGLLLTAAVGAVMGIVVVRRVYGPQAMPIYSDEIRTLVIPTPKEGTQVAV